MKDYDPITAPIAEGDFNGPHGELPSELEEIVTATKETIKYWRQRAEKAELEAARLKELYEIYSSGCEREQARKEKAEAELAESDAALTIARQTQSELASGGPARLSYRNALF